MANNETPKKRLDVKFTISASRKTYVNMVVDLPLVTADERIETHVRRGNLTVNEGTPSSEIGDALMSALFPGEEWKLAELKLDYV